MPLYGMDIEIARKMAAKRDESLDNQAKAWIEDVLNEKLPEDKSLHDILKSGIHLCRVMNVIQAGSIKKINLRGGAFAFRENIQAFQRAARQFGVHDAELFQTMDLFEKRNVAQVTLSLFALSRQAARKGFAGPHLTHRKVYTPSLAGADTSENESKHHTTSMHNASVIAVREPLAYEHFLKCSKKYEHCGSVEERVNVVSQQNGSQISRKIEEVQKDSDLSFLAKVALCSPDLDKKELISMLQKYTQDKIGSVEQATLKEIIRDYGSDLSVTEKPLCDYSDFLPELICLILLEDD